MTAQDCVVLAQLANTAEALRASLALGEAAGWGQILDELRGALSGVEHVIREGS